MDGDLRRLFSVRLPKAPRSGHLDTHSTVLFDEVLVTDLSGEGRILRFSLSTTGSAGFLDFGEFQSVYRGHPEIHSKYLSNPLDIRGNRQGILAFIRASAEDEATIAEFKLEIHDAKAGRSFTLDSLGEHEFSLPEAAPKGRSRLASWAKTRAREILVGAIASIIGGIILLLATADNGPPVTTILAPATSGSENTTNTISSVVTTASATTAGTVSTSPVATASTATTATTTVPPEPRPPGEREILILEQSRIGFVGDFEDWDLEEVTAGDLIRIATYTAERYGNYDFYILDEYGMELESARGDQTAEVFLNWEVPSDGHYVIRVVNDSRTFGYDGQGDYRVEVTAK